MVSLAPIQGLRFARGRDTYRRVFPTSLSRNGPLGKIALGGAAPYLKAAGEDAGDQTARAASARLVRRM